MNLKCLIFGHDWKLETKVLEDDFVRCARCGILRVKTSDEKYYKLEHS